MARMVWQFWSGPHGGAFFFSSDLLLVLPVCETVSLGGEIPGLVILIFVGFVIGSYILASFLAIIMSAEILEKAQEFQELQRTDPENPAVIFPAVAELMKAFAIPYAVAYFLFGALCAFIPNAAMGQRSESTFD